jgi:hypothetical protein
MIRQVRIENWPLGLERDLAFVRVPVSILARRGRIRLRRSFDGLDDFSGAVVQLETNRFAAILQYAHSPISGTKIVVSDFSKRTVFDVLKLLDLKRSELLWVNPEAEITVESAFRAGGDHVPVRGLIRRKWMKPAEMLPAERKGEWRLAA